MPDREPLSEQELAGIRARAEVVTPGAMNSPWEDWYAMDVPRLLAALQALTLERDGARNALMVIEVMTVNAADTPHGRYLRKVHAIAGAALSGARVEGGGAEQ